MSQHTEDFVIRRRPGWGEPITVVIECDPLVTPGLKLGLAVMAAVGSGENLRGTVLIGAVLRGAILRDADLSDAILIGAHLSDAILRGADLDGAYLGGADLRGANLSGAILSSVDLSDAILRGAILRGEKITRLFARLDRQVDPHSFAAMELEAGGYKVLAGCRWFSDAEFRAHVAAKYPDTEKAVETLAILDFIAARAVALGITKAEGN